MLSFCVMPLPLDSKRKMLSTVCGMFTFVSFVILSKQSAPMVLMPSGKTISVMVVLPWKA